MIAALFCRSDSVYKSFVETTCFDLERDARKYEGPFPVVAHPPCRSWGRLSHMAKPRPDEKDLARFAVSCVQKFGGVLEHPSASRLFTDQGLPRPGTQCRDQFGGFSYPVDQSWFGHSAPKRTWLYIVGVEPYKLPEIPFHLGVASGRVASGMSRADRERTPLAFAIWLATVARSCAK